MEIVNKTVATVKNNWIGGIVGGVAGYFVAKKAIKTEKTWVKVVSVLAGIVVGGTAQAKFFAKKSAPTASTVKK